MATSSRAAIGFIAAVLVAVLAGCGMATASHQVSDRPAGTVAPVRGTTAVPPVRGLAVRPAPAGWRRAALPGDQAVLAYPPSMHLVSGDPGTVSAAQLSSSGAYLMYLNATPRQGTESLRNWPAFRLRHLLDDDASAARLLAQSRGVSFAGGTGSCVVDAYVTKIHRHHYTELACYVQGRTSASVIIAAAPTAGRATLPRALTRAVGAYQTR
jgi:hypothetical protein